MPETLDLVSLCCRAPVSHTITPARPYLCAKCRHGCDAVRPDRVPGPHPWGESTKEPSCAR
jgi:hypothetical protein